MKDNEKVILKYSWENLCSTEYHNYIPLSAVEGGKSTAVCNWPDIVSDVSPEYIKLNNKALSLKEISSSLDKPCSLLYYKKSEQCQMNEEEWNKNAFNKLTHNMVNRVTLVLSQLPGNKLKLSLFRFRKEKRAGFQNFKKSSDDIHITINKDTKNWFFTRTTFSNRKRNVTTSKNPFIWVENKLEESFKLPNIFGWYRVVTHIDVVDTEDPVRKEMVKALIKVYSEMGNRLEQKPDQRISHNIINDIIPTFGYNLGVLIGKWFCKERKIKLPDNWQNYFFNWYPGVKRIRKTQMKLLPAIIQGYGIKSKYINQLLNQYPTLNINDIVLWFTILGPDFFRQLPLSLLTTTSSADTYRVIGPHSKKSDLDEQSPLSVARKVAHSLTTQERRNIISITKTMEDASPYFLGEIRDHVCTKIKLSKLGENVSIIAKTTEEFKREHHDWASLMHYLMSDQSTQYYYKPQTLELIQKDYKNYNVLILKNESDYFEEGESQKNCVRGYLSQYGSLIFSIRDSENKRLTCEVLDGKIVQVREVCNGEPGEEWDEVLVEMKKRVKKLFSMSLLKPCVKIVYKKAKIEKWVVKEGIRVTRLEEGYISDEEFVMAEPDDLPF
jgi:hypothetical protein